MEPLCSEQNTWPVLHHVGRRHQANIPYALQKEDTIKMKLSSQGGLVITLKELVDMKRIGFKYKLNHKTKELIQLRNFISQEINYRMRGQEHEKKDIPTDQKRT